MYLSTRNKNTKKSIITKKEILMALIVYGSVGLSQLAGILSVNNNSSIIYFVSVFITYVATGVFSFILSARMIDRNKRLREEKVLSDIKK